MMKPSNNTVKHVFTLLVAKVTTLVVVLYPGLFQEILDNQSAVLLVTGGSMTLIGTMFWSIPNNPTMSRIGMASMLFGWTILSYKGIAFFIADFPVVGLIILSFVLSVLITFITTYILNIQE